MAGGERMQAHAMMLGGLEPPYMKKLALYFSSRLGERLAVGIVDDPCACDAQGQDTVWVGPKHFLDQVRDRMEEARCILLTEESEADGGICRYQSCEKLYQKIMLCYRQLEGAPADISAVKQKWIIITTDQTAASLMAFSVICAQILGDRSDVLYLNFSECCGMERAFLLEEGTDLSDLVLGLEKGDTLCLDACVRRMEQMDYVLPPANPMVLHEIRADDIAHLIRVIEQSAAYQYVVVALGTSCCGCEGFFQKAFRVFHLTGTGESAVCSRQEWQEFIRLCLDTRQIPVEQICLPEVNMEDCGVHLVHEWAEGELGMIARRCLAECEE
ncbi:MAG: hypothetical protein LUC83_10720 [Clostridiales bacterium]|nr:hypothetical protein [Clostridiales bacterium]